MGTAVSGKVQAQAPTACLVAAWSQVTGVRGVRAAQVRPADRSSAERGIGLQAAGGTGNSAGLAGQGSGSGVGVTGVGGVTGDGGDFRGGTTSGTGCTVTGGGASGIGLLATGGGSNGNAIEAVAPGSGLALKATGAISTNDSVYADVVLRAGTSSTCTMRANRVEFDGVTHQRRTHRSSTRCGPSTRLAFGPRSSPTVLVT